MSGTHCGVYRIGQDVVLETQIFLHWSLNIIKKEELILQGFPNKILTHSTAFKFCTITNAGYTAKIFLLHSTCENCQDT